MQLVNGYTLMHEHMSIDLSDGDLGTGSFDLLCSDLLEVRKYGVRTIVDLTNQSMGRSPEYIQKLTDATGINIIMSTGYYLERYIGRYTEDLSAEEIADEAVRDLTAGIGSSGVKAGLIGEIAWSHDGPGTQELKTWEAMCLAARMTGAVISTHPSYGTQQIPQAAYLINQGIDPGKILIGHIEFFPDDDALKKLLDMGVYIGLDMVGKQPERDEYRADTVLMVKEWGYLSKLFLSLDLCRTTDLKSAGGYGYAYLFEAFIPMLRERGLSTDDIELMLKTNPQTFLR